MKATGGVCNICKEYHAREKNTIKKIDNKEKLVCVKCAYQ